MMTAMTFDALKYCRELQNGGFTREQAETLAKVHQESLAEAVKDVVTTSSLEDKQLATKADLRVALAEQTARIERRFTEIDARVSDVKVSLIKWMVGLILGQTAMLVAIIFGLFAYLPQVLGLVGK